MQDETIEMIAAENRGSSSFDVKEATKDRNYWAALLVGLSGTTGVLIATTVAMPKIPLMLVPTLGLDALGAGMTCLAMREAIKAQNYLRKLTK